MTFNELHEIALEAAKTATDKFIEKHGDWDCCGFAWVHASVKGNTKVGKAFKAVGFTKAYGGGYQLWNPSGSSTQSLSAKEAGTDAYVKVIRQYLPEIGVFAQSRMD
jgi:hypothetical protein